MRIAYFGQEGSFAHEAAIKAFPHARIYVPGSNATGVLQTLYEGKADCGVVPIENNSEGAIAESVDALLSPAFIRHPHRIQEELTLPVHLHLLSNVPLKKIRTVYSHPVPLDRLNGWLSRHLPGVSRMRAHSTAEGAMLAAREPDRAAAIANKAAATIYGLKILRSRLTHAPNQTRFYAIAREPLSRQPPERTAVCFALPNRPGSLVKLLSIFAAAKINLTRIISRPLDKRERGFRPDEYAFWVDFEGAPRLTRVSQALGRARRATIFLDIMGAYISRRLC